MSGRARRDRARRREPLLPDPAAPAPAGRAEGGSRIETTGRDGRPRTTTRAAAARGDGSRRRLILVCGPGGTGKTTLADLLSHELGVACLHKDDVKTALHDAGIVTDRSFHVFRNLVEQQLSHGIDLIAEATMHVPDDWDLLSGWRDRYDLDLVCVVCSAGRDERERRIRTRVRHPAHAGADRRQLSELDADVDYSQLPGRLIRISTEEEPQACVLAVLAQLA